MFHALHIALYYGFQFLFHKNEGRVQYLVVLNVVAHEPIFLEVICSCYVFSVKLYYVVAFHVLVGAIAVVHRPRLVGRCVEQVNEIITSAHMTPSRNQEFIDTIRKELNEL